MTGNSKRNDPLQPAHSLTSLWQYPAIKLAVLLAAGILLQHLFALHWLIPLVLIGLSIPPLLLQLFRRNGQVSGTLNSAFTILLILSAGALLYASSDAARTRSLIDTPVEKESRITGTIKSIELMGKYDLKVVLSADSIFYGITTKAVNSDILLRISDRERARCLALQNRMLPGFRISATGALLTPPGIRNPGGFDYADYLRKHGISNILKVNDAEDVTILESRPDYFSSLFYEMRLDFASRIDSNFSGISAPVLKALLLGDRNTLSDETKSVFIDAGVFHVLAVSGLHVGIIAVLISVFFQRFHIKTRIWLVMLFLLFFLFLTGAPASVTRATIMSILFLITLLTGRSTNPVNTLAVAVIILLLLNPADLLLAGFQLSVAAAFTIIYAVRYVPFIPGYLTALRHKAPAAAWALSLLYISFAAMLGALPFVLLYFDQVSFGSLALNFLVIPATGLLIAGGFIVVLSSYLLPFFAATTALAVNQFIHLLLWIIEKASYAGWAVFRVRQFGTLDAVIVLFLLLFMFFVIVRFRHWYAAAALGMLVLLNSSVYTSLTNCDLFPENQMTLMMMDVGQGDALFLKTPGGKTMLIDAGAANEFHDRGEETLLPFFYRSGIDKIDYAFASHVDADHTGGFTALMQRGFIDSLCTPAADPASVKDVRFANMLRARGVEQIPYRYEKTSVDGIRIYQLSGGDRLHLSDNDRSGILKVQFGEVSVLFTGDAGFAAEAILFDLFEPMLDADVLKISHHGSRFNSSLSFISRVNPSIALISCGINNAYHHPHLHTLNRLSYAGAELLRTDRDGAVILTTDGKTIERIDWRKQFSCF